MSVHEPGEADHRKLRDRDPHRRLAAPVGQVQVEWAPCLAFVPCLTSSALQGTHIRFDDEDGHAVPSPANTQVRLRGVPVPRNTHIRFE